MNLPPGILQSFSSISLHEMDNVKLLDRVDTKFVFHSTLLPTVIDKIASHYYILEVNGNRLSKYETLYFDTDNFDLYTLHQNKKLNRYKIRKRNYTESNLSFLELKFKDNKSRTVKKRIQTEGISTGFSEKEVQFLEENSTLNPANYYEKLWVNYSRITLVNKTSNERLTIDVNLSFKKGDTVYNMDNLVIAELKQEKSSVSEYGEVMKMLHIHKGSMSKYCIGVALAFEGVKKNNFKSTLSFLKKLAHVA